MLKMENCNLQKLLITPNVETIPFVKAVGGEVGTAPTEEKLSSSLV